MQTSLPPDPMARCGSRTIAITRLDASIPRSTSWNTLFRLRTQVCRGSRLVPMAIFGLSRGTTGISGCCSYNMYRAIQFALLAAAMTALPLATRAATTTQILASPRNYDGQHVEVTGRIWHPRIVTEANGATYVRFIL